MHHLRRQADRKHLLIAANALRHPSEHIVGSNRAANNYSVLERGESETPLANGHQPCRCTAAPRYFRRDRSYPTPLNAAQSHYPTGLQHSRDIWSSAPKNHQRQADPAHIRNNAEKRKFYLAHIPQKIV